MFEYFKENLFLQSFALIKVPLIGFVKPKIIDLSDSAIVIKIRLNRKTKNHLHSMYFGALAIGAELTVGALAMKKIIHDKSKISLVFKDFHADFLKRAMNDVHFTCEAGQQINQLVEKVNTTGLRQQETIQVYATVPKINASEKIATFSLTLSLKPKNSDAAHLR